MDAETEKHCTILIFYDKGVPPTSDELRVRLEDKKDSVKAEALEELILLMINGEIFPNLLMTVIRFCATSNDHRVKKLLMVFWECVDKHKENGELREEMILVCNALRNDLMHANEYVRGCTARLLCKMRYYRIIEPLKEAILRNLSHRHSYVRRNAVMCIYSLVKSFGIEVMPEAINDVEELLLVEGDLATKRNAFLMLLHCDVERATKYVLSVQDQIPGMGDILQLVVLELVRKVCRTNPMQKGRLLRIIFNLTSSSSMAVSYDCASSLVALSSLPMAIVQATQAYVKLLTEQSDNNVKLIVLDRLQEVRKHHRQVMETMVMDTLRALSCPSLDVRKKVMDIGMSLVSPRNIKEVVALLKKEVMKTLGHDAQSVEGNMEYRRLLIRAIHACTGQCADQAQGVMFLLMDFLTENDQTSATEVAMFLRELIANHVDVRAPILEKLSEILGDIQQSQVLRVSLWLFGEYCEDPELINNVIATIVTSLKPLPLVPEDPQAKEAKKDTAADAEKKAGGGGKYTTRTIVLADGTYGTENVYTADPEAQEAEKKQDIKKTHLRTAVLGGDFLLSSMVGVSLTKLCMKAGGLSTATRNEVLFILANLYKLVREHAAGGEQSGGAVRLTQCVRALIADGGKSLAENQKAAADLLKKEWSSNAGRGQLASVLELATANSEWALGSGEDEVEEKHVAPDESIVFRQLLQRKGVAGGDGIEDDDDFKMALRSGGSADADGSLFSKRLAKVQQMTGLADPVYVEAFLQVHSFDLVLELLMVNRTSDTLTNVLVELSTQGDLKLVDRPQGVTLAPGQQMMVHASIKVGSTETGIIFGYVTYEKQPTAAEKAEKAERERQEKANRSMMAMDEPPPDLPSSRGSNMQKSMMGMVKRFKQITGANQEGGYEAVWEEVHQESIVLNELHVDILDYIERAWIGELAFRTMWSEFEWENKININTSITEVGAFLEHIMLNTKMSVVGRSYKTGSTAKGKKKEKITAEDVKEMLREAHGVQKLIDTSSFVAVNLYAKSIFGEDALANISIEKQLDGKLTGSVRIRSRTQGIALSLGDRITIVQRGVTGAKQGSKS